VSLGELSDFDCEGQVAGAQHVDHPVVGEPGLETQLLEDAGVSAGSDSGLVLAVGAGASYFAGRPEMIRLG
jgi:hypothetical protein